MRFRKWKDENDQNRIYITFPLIHFVRNQKVPTINQNPEPDTEKKQLTVTAELTETLVLGGSAMRRRFGI